MATRTGTPIPSSAPSQLHRMPRTLAGDAQVADAAARKQTLALYESAMKLLHAKKYDKAHIAFTNMLAAAPPDLAASIRMYIVTCVGQIDKGEAHFESHEEQYDYAISLLNHGNYQDARKHFAEILLKNPTADYAFYGLALLESMTGNTGECIRHLTEAIRLNAQYRFQARSDSDFDGVSDDPTFTDLLYPEAI